MAVNALFGWTGNSPGAALGRQVDSITSIQRRRHRRRRMDVVFYLVYAKIHPSIVLNVFEELAHAAFGQRPDKLLHGLAIVERNDRWERADLFHISQMYERKGSEGRGFI